MSADLSKANPITDQTSSHDGIPGVYRAISIGLFVLLWHLISVANRDWLNFADPILIPGPVEVFQAGIEFSQSGQLQRDIAATVYRVVAGFGVAAVAGLLAGVAVATWRPLAVLLEPVVELLRSIPPLAFLPMMVLWFGIGEASKIAFIAYAAFFPMFVTTLEGVKFVDPVLVRAAASLGAKPLHILRYVTLPAALPGIITGLRLALSLSFFVIVAAEFVAADSGLGFMINDARTFFLMPQMLLGAIVTGIIGFLFNEVLRLLEARIFRWRKGART